MNKRSLLTTKLIALLLLAVMALSMIGCDKLPFLGQQNEPENNESQDDGNKETPDDGGHAHDYVDGFCDCGSVDPNYVPEHIHKFILGKCECGEVDPNYQPQHKHSYVDGKCECGETDPNYQPENPDHQHEFVDGKCECGEEVSTITIAEAIKICQANSEPTTERYYIKATVKTISDLQYGEMTIYDETGELYVYGTYSNDGSLSFNQMEATPVKGDTVLLYCTLNNHNGENQVKNARLISFVHNEVDPEDLEAYKSVSIYDARDAEVGELVRVSGVVARITYANGMKPSGVILVDGTSSIYVYDGDLAGQVSIGNKIEIAGAKAYWILENEQTNAEKFGYMGSNQLENVILISNDKGTNDFDKDWITETTIKEIMDTPVTENITNKIFKVTSLVHKAEGTGFTNYYFNDIDGVTGSYVYTQCNGSDFGWLDEFDGKFCTVYLVAINAKSSSTGCLWRFLPVAVADEGYEFDTDTAGEYAVKYHALGQFISVYNADPILKLVSSVSSELLGFEGATLTYSSDNVPVVHFSTDADGDIVMHCEQNGTANVTITGSYNGKEYSETIVIEVLDPEKIDCITVADAIEAEVDSTVTVRGIVGPSVVNKDGFYLFGEDGSVIAVLVNNLSQFAGLEMGHEVILTGMRERYVKDDATTLAGQSCIVSAEILANLYGNHEYSTEKFVTGMTAPELYALDKTVDYSTTVFVAEVKVVFNATAYYTNVSIVDPNGSTKLTLYCSGGAQYSFLEQFNGQTVTMELAACNWNEKSFWAFCALSVITEDGKIYNTLNFDKN